MRIPPTNVVMRLDRGYAMSEPNFLPWLKKANDKEAERAAEQFYGGARVAMYANSSKILFPIIAGYVGAWSATRTGNKK